MQFVLISDTHGDAVIIERVKRFYPNADLFIHCGDSELAADHESLQNVHVVQGNCDWRKRFEDEIIIPVENIKIFVTHGHLYNVKSSIMSLYYRAKEVGANVVCFGHSHLLGAEKIDDTVFLNPGSLRKPRGRKEKSFIVGELKGNVLNVKCLDEMNQLIDEFTFDVSVN